MNNDVISMELPTSLGRFRMHVWRGERGRELVALSTPNLKKDSDIILRIQSECLSGDIFHSRLCDCEEQKDRALREIQASENGVFIYHRQEGRNAGLYNKVRIYNLMQLGMDTYSASRSLTGSADSREYSDVLVALKFLIPTHARIKLLTNNPDKVKFLRNHGYIVSKQQLKSKAEKYNTAYLEAQAARFGGV